MKVSVVSTVKDAEPFIAQFLDSLRAQTRAPDEIVIVDGGSTDETFERLEATPWLQALRVPGANIARGRNAGIRAAAHDVLALTDADCMLAPDWLGRLVEPIEAGADVAAGVYRPLATTFLQACAAAVSVPELDEIRPGWMPSSRSVAFRREAWTAGGGYPEWLDVGEDMYFNHRLVEAGCRMELAPEAVAYWRPRPTLAATWSQYARYSEGDAVSGMYPQRHLLRLGVYGALGAALASRNRVALALAAVAGAAYTAKPLRRAWRRLPADTGERPAALAAVPAMMAFIDAAKMWGYLQGLSRHAR